MDKETFILLSHDYAITLRVMGFKDAAAELRQLEQEASNNFGRIFWNRRLAAHKFYSVAGLLQDHVAESLSAH